MGKDGKKPKAASAARAGELLVSANPPGTGFGFGGYVGSQTLAELRASAGAQETSTTLDSPALVQLDAELSLNLRRLSKRDTITKVKALQALKSIVQSKDAAELSNLLPLWAHTYQRLVMDNSRAVREEASVLQGLIAAGVGRSLAPYLKQCMGPWFMAQFDPQPEVARAALSATHIVFPGTKLQEALKFCKASVLEYLMENLRSTAEALGDSQRESKEELHERYERVTASSLLALSGWINYASEWGGKDGESRNVVEAILSQPGFFKKFLGSKSSVIRRPSYALICQVSRRLPGVVKANAPNALAILGALGDKDLSTHSELWGMVLAYSKSHPEAWSSADVHKNIFPKLLALLRNGCYGSAAGSYPAILPLLTLLPSPILDPVMPQLLDAILAGFALCATGNAPATAESAHAAASCFIECWAFALSRVKRSEGLAAQASVASLCESLLANRLVALALGGATNTREEATRIIIECVLSCCTTDGSAHGDLLQTALHAVGSAIVLCLGKAADESHNILLRAEHLLFALDFALSHKGENPARRLLELVAQPIMKIVAPRSRSGESEAAQLIATLIKRFGNDLELGVEEGASASSLVVAEEAYLALPPHTASSKAHAELLLVCLKRGASPAEDLARVLEKLVVTDGGAHALFLAQQLVDCVTGSISSDVRDTEDHQGVVSWRCKKLDELAEHFLSEAIRKGSEHAGQLLGSLICGDGKTSLLSRDALQHCLAQLCRIVGETGNGQSAANVCLRACLFEAPVWAMGEDDDGHFDVLMAIVDKVYDATLSHEQDCLGMDGFSVAKLPRLMDFARMQKIAWRLTETLINHIQRLVRCDPGGNWAIQAAHLVTDLRLALEQAAQHNGQELDAAFLDPVDAALISTHPCWPKFVTITLQEPGSTMGLASGHGKGKALGPPAAAHSEDCDRIAQGLTTMAAHICTILGVEVSICSPSRRWLAAEMLCWANFGNEAAGKLQGSLESCLLTLLESGTGIEERMSSQTLLADTIQRLWHCLEADCDPGTPTSVALLSLMDLLPCRGRSTTTPNEPSLLQQLLGCWVEELLSQTARKSGCQRRAFSVLAGLVRREARGSQVKACQLGDYACHCISQVTNQPPLWQALSSDPGQAHGILEGLRDVIACFPVHAGQSISAAAALPGEIRELTALTQQQLRGETSATALSAAMVRSGTAGGQPGERRGLEQQAEMVMAQLLAATVAYCRQALNADLWVTLQSRLQAGAQLATTSLEDTAEAFVSAAMSAAKRLDPSVTSSTCVAVLWHLQAHLSENATQLFQEATEGVEELFSDDSRVVELSDVPCAWLQACATCLPFVLPDDPTAKVPSCGSALISDVFRCFYCVGIVAAVACAAGEASKLLFSHWVADLRGLIEAVMTACIASLPWETEVIIAGRAVDVWSEETGVDSVAASLALLTNGAPEPLLQKMAIQILLLAPNSEGLCRKLDDEEDDEVDKGQASAEASGDHIAMLLAAGVRMELVTALVPTSHDDDASESEGGWQGAQSELLAWAVLLAYLLEQPPESATRARVSRAIQETHSLVPGLLSRLVPLLPLEAPEALDSQNARLSPVEAAGTAAAARAEGKGSDTVTWSFSNALRSAESLHACQLAADIFRATLRALPASARSWYHSIRDKKLANAVEAYTMAKESRAIIARELAGVAGRASHGETTDAGNIEFSVRAKLATREAVAVVSLEESVVLELCIRLPAAWPLQDAKVDCKKGMGVAEARLRKWMLSITALLRSQNSALSDAINLWQRNCAKQFAGVEECLICYNVSLAGTGQLPKLTCKTCSKRYHGVCLYKWFRSSAKSVCPHCQSAW